MSEVAFVLIKPDAVGRVGQIIARIERQKLSIFGLQERYKTAGWAREHYSHMYDHSCFEALTTFMASDSVIGFNAIGYEAIRRLRLLAGSAVDPSPGTIRFDYGARGIYNLIHVSDSIEAADRERGLFYDENWDIPRPE